MKVHLWSTAVLLFALATNPASAVALDSHSADDNPAEVQTVGVKKVKPPVCIQKEGSPQKLPPLPKPSPIPVPNAADLPPLPPPNKTPGIFP